MTAGAIIAVAVFVVIMCGPTVFGLLMERRIAIAAAARQGGDAKQAPGGSSGSTVGRVRARIGGSMNDFRPIAGKPVDIDDCEMVGEPAHFIMVFLRAVKALEKIAKASERIADRMEKGK